MRELRRGSRTSPHETRDKRMRTDERIVAAELELEDLGRGDFEEDE